MTVGDKERTFNGSNQKIDVLMQLGRHSMSSLPHRMENHTLTAYFVHNQRQKESERESESEF